MTAQTNSGMAVADRPPTEMMRSLGRPSCSEANTPPRIASGTTMMNASTASLAEWASAGQMMLDTDWPMATEVPMSPCRRPVIQSQYWAKTDWSVPSLWLSASTACWEASGPRTRRPTSPGSTCAPKNTPTLSSHSVIRPRRTRLPMKRVMASGHQARPADVDVAHGGRLHAGHAVRCSAEEVIEVREDHRHLVEQQLLDLAGGAALGADVERADVIGDELVVGRVLEVRGVPRPLAFQRGG